jgi:hypothetical protein
MFHQISGCCTGSPGILVFFNPVFKSRQLNKAIIVPDVLNQNAETA